MPASTVAVYLALGDHETAIAKLEEAARCGRPRFVSSRDDPRPAAMRGDPVVEGQWARTAPVRSRFLENGGVGGSLIVGPHSKYAYDFHFGKDLIHQAIVDVESPGASARKVADKLLE